MMQHPTKVKGAGATMDGGGFAAEGDLTLCGIVRTTRRAVGFGGTW